MRKVIHISLAALFLVIITTACKKAEVKTEDVEDPIPAESSAAEPETGQDSVNNPCNNVLLPMVEGNEWIYESQIQGEDGQPEIIEFAWTISDVFDSSAELGTLFYESGSVLKATVECEDGALLNFPMTEMNLVFGEVEGEMEIDYVSGVFFPSIEDFETANWEYTWNSNFTTSGTITASYEGETITMELAESPVSIEWEILQTDVPLQVAAGSFSDTIQIQQTVTLDLTSLTINIEDQEFQLATTLTLKTKNWYGRYIGLLKQEVESASINLYDMDFPLESTGRIELKSTNITK